MNDETAETRGPAEPGEPATLADPTGTPAGPTGASAMATGDEPTLAGASATPASDEPTLVDATAGPAPTASDEPPTAWMPPTGAPEADVPVDATPENGAPGNGTPGPENGPANVPPWAAGFNGFNANLFRERLVRPRTGKHVAGVCAALARATNTDPVLWRVVFAVLAVMSGVGVLLYLVAWLITPAEGDTASPAEALVGRGRTSLSQASTILLGIGALVSFGFVVRDGVRTSLLAAAVIIGAFVLFKRNSPAMTQPTPPPFTPPPFTPPPFTAPPFTAPPFTAPQPFAEPVAFTEPVTVTPPATGYRPPFAPHGPFAPQAGQFPFGNQGAPAFPQQPPPPKAPKPPRERSVLGKLTFFAVFVVIGLLALLATAGTSVPVSAFFAAALAVIGAGLIVGAWFGRARGLIALALVTTLGLVVSTGVERWGGDIGRSVYRPTSFAELPDRYDFKVGNATIDLTDLDFTGKTENVTITMKFGQVKVLLPKDVDTTTDVQMKNGRAQILGKEYDGHQLSDRTVTDTGADGIGGGTLDLTLQMDTGNLEVTR